MTLSMVQQLTNNQRLLESCPEPFDEGLLWQAREPAEKVKLEQQLQVRWHFCNLAAIICIVAPA